MEGDDSCLKYFSLRPLQGKKMLFILVIINVVFIWLVYKNSTNYISCFSQSSIYVSTKSPNAPLYNVPIFHIPLLSSKDMTPYYGEVAPDTWCLLQSTDMIESKIRQKCICLPHWFGLDCGIPSSVWKSRFLQEGKNAGVEIRRRDKPRRIILSIVFDEAFDLLEINIRNSYSVIDIFLIADKGNNSDSIFSMFKKGYLAEFQSKVMPVFLHKSDFYKEEHERISSVLNDLWIIGWKRLSDFRPDDLFMFSHASSIISNDVLLFLKLYDGYPEPFNFSLRPLLFKFSRVLKSSNKNHTLVPFEPSGCTLQYISTMCEYSVSKFLLTKCLTNKSQQISFEEKHWSIKEWNIGREDFPSGWQCNFCCSTDCILNIVKKRRWIHKMSALLSLNYQNVRNVNVSVIEQIIELKSFNGYNLTYEKSVPSDVYFAPKVVLDFKKYKYLLD